MLSLMAAILASTMMAFEGSVMRPVSEALVDCARRTGASTARKRKASVGTLRIGQPHYLLEIMRLLPNLLWVNPPIG